MNRLKKRYDIVVFNSDGTVEILVECKSYTIPVSQEVFDQIARYNLPMQATYLMVTNGMEHYYCQMDARAEKYSFLPQIPDFSR